jgi:hypothetical protein
MPGSLRMRALCGGICLEPCALVPVNLLSSGMGYLSRAVCHAQRNPREVRAPKCAITIHPMV